MPHVKIYEFKRRRKDGVATWESIQLMGSLETTKQSALTFASNLAIMTRSEIRVNEKGSEQGHYFRGF